MKLIIDCSLTQILGKTQNVHFCACFRFYCIYKFFTQFISYHGVTSYFEKTTQTNNKNNILGSCEVPNIKTGSFLIQASMKSYLLREKIILFFSVYKTHISQYPTFF